jgi:hypothetical protein
MPLSERAMAQRRGRGVGAGNIAGPQSEH